MKDIVELLRLPSPTPRPQALASDGDRLWIGSIETCRLYAMDIEKWTVTEEAQAPGKPWGATMLGDELLVLLGMPPDDDRFVKHFVPGHGFRDEGGFQCPDNTGSHLSYDGDFIYVSQWYNKRILQLDRSGNPLREIPVPHEICGHTIVDGRFHCLTTDDESSGEYWLTRVDARGERVVAEDLARIPFAARALAFDGRRYWTNHREKNETVAFEVA